MSIEVQVKKQLGKFQLDLDFQSHNGVLGMIGASGCGKSMTLRSIAGIVKPDEGMIRLNDKVLYSQREHIFLPPQKRKVGYLFQNYALFPHMTLAQNIACGCHELKDKKEKKIQVVQIMERMQLIGLEKHYPHQLSGGQQQRGALARILVSKPDILLLDEPVSALDIHLKEQLMAELKTTIRDFAKDVILVTHSRDEAFGLCDHLAIMEIGRASCRERGYDLG